MALSPLRQDPDPDRRRRRLELLAARADAKSARESAQPRRLRGARLRELIATRRPPDQLTAANRAAARRY